MQSNLTKRAASSELRVLVAHNRYQQRGGEDAVVAAEVKLLRTRGHAVELFELDNAEISQMSKVRVLSDTLWSRRSSRAVENLLARFSPHVLHAHNTFPLISPAVYWAAGRAGIPVVQTLHNFRLLCPQAMFLREAKVCEDCLGKVPWRGVVRKCYHGSMLQSGVVTSMLTLHRALGTYSGKVTRYIALNEFCRAKFVQGGLPPEKVVVKPNFVDIATAPGYARKGGLFVGRLAAEKGTATLLNALRLLPGVSIDVVGTGPEQELIRHPGVRAAGWLEPDQVRQMMYRAAYLVMPSVWYETFGMVLVEAFACGLPVLATRLGSMAEAIGDKRTGLLFTAGSAEDLAKKIAWAERNPEQMRAMGRNARDEYETKYTPDVNYSRLLRIYQDAIACGRRPASVPSH
jgi:glycosyltransferase involved in cell wall biosynthesis